jgi:hypothetical protein
MNLFFAYLFHLLYGWQNKYFVNKKHAALYASAMMGIFFGMNLMFISYLFSFFFFDDVILFLRSYYIFIALLIVLITISAMLYKARYQSLLSLVLKIEKPIHSKYRILAFIYMGITVLGYALASYTLFDEVYFSQ